MTRIRGALKEILPGVLYQRGQLLTMPRAGKQKLLEEAGITIVVNLWSKMDTDLADDYDGPLYIHAPMRGDEKLFGIQARELAKAVAAMLMNGGETALILCEAGRTRSVLFSAMVLKAMGRDGTEALQFVEQACGTIKLRPSMIHFIWEGKCDYTN